MVLGKGNIQNTKKFSKYVKMDNLDDYATGRQRKTRTELKKTKLGRKTEEGLTSASNTHRLYVVREPK